MNNLLFGILIAIGFILLTEKGGDENNESVDTKQKHVLNGGHSGINSSKHTAGGKRNWNSINTKDF